MKASMIFRRLDAFFCFISDGSAGQLLAELLGVACAGRWPSSRLADRLGADLGGEAVVAELVLVARCTRLRVSSWCCLSGVRPGSMTM